MRLKEWEWERATGTENDWERGVTEVLSEMTGEQGRKGKKGQTQTEVQKFFHTLALKWLNTHIHAQRALSPYRWRIKIHFYISGKRSYQVWTSFTCFSERPFNTLHPKHLYRATRHTRTTRHWHWVIHRSFWRNCTSFRCRNHTTDKRQSFSRNTTLSFAKDTQ